MNNEKKDKTPVSMAVYQQFVFDCAASLMEENCDKEQIIHRLIDLSNLPVFPDISANGRAADTKGSIPKVKVIIDEGIVSDVLADGPVEVEVINICKDFADYEQLQDHRNQIYQDETLKVVDYFSANFEENNEQ